MKPGRFGGFEIKDLNVPKKNVFYFPPRSQRYSDSTTYFLSEKVNATIVNFLKFIFHARTASTKNLKQ